MSAGQNHPTGPQDLFPALPSASLLPWEPGKLPAQCIRPRILLIDDTPTIHDDFRKILGDQGEPSLEDAERELFGISTCSPVRTSFDLDSAYQGQEGLAAVQRALAEGRPYSLVFLDIRMPPGWDGIETLEHLWKADPDLQVVIATAYSDYSWSEISRRIGSTDSLAILKKPFDNIEVLQLAHTLTKKWQLALASKQQLGLMENAVRERTAQLRIANENLRLEILERLRAEARIKAFSDLGQRLSATKTAAAAAEIIVEVADQLIGWHACNFDLYLSEDDLIQPVLYMDEVGGGRKLCTPERRRRPSPLTRKAIDQGGQLILKEDPFQRVPNSTPFGDVARPSASLIVVPLRNGPVVSGILAIHSYTSQAYDQASLETLQALADHCGGALDRIQKEEALAAAQAQLRQSQKLEAIGQLAGGVAHDFNNLLTVIRGNAELALMGSATEEAPFKESLAQVISAADRAAGLTRQLLAFGRKQMMQFQSVNPNEVVSNLTTMLKRIIGEDITLQCSYGAGVPSVQADVGMLEQLLVNLVVNARDAMPGGGQLKITTQLKDIDADYALAHAESRPGRFAVLGVSDTGTGISPEHLPRIFEPFFTTKDVGKGTGLGLATVYGIVKQHNGWIEVESKLGLGATFTVFIPATQVEAVLAPAPAAPSKLPRGTEMILLVEDEDTVRRLTRQLLEKYGYTVHEAASGRAALDLYQTGAHTFNLLLTDVIMPEGITGRDLAERLRRSNPDLKIVFTSGYSRDVLDHDADLMRRLNARFIPKPCSPPLLLQTIRQSLDDDAASTSGNGKGLNAENGAHSNLGLSTQEHLLPQTVSGR